MNIPDNIPQLQYTSDVCTRILLMAAVCGFRVVEESRGIYQLHVGDDCFRIPERSLYKRALAELAELAGSRICYGFNEHMFYTLSRLTTPVLVRAVAQGLDKRKQSQEPLV